jgi:hypothetical protein
MLTCTSDNWLFYQNAGVGPMQGQASKFYDISSLFRGPDPTPSCSSSRWLTRTHRSLHPLRSRAHRVRREQVPE